MSKIKESEYNRTIKKIVWIENRISKKEKTVEKNNKEVVELKIKMWKLITKIDTIKRKGL